MLNILFVVEQRGCKRVVISFSASENIGYTLERVQFDLYIYRIGTVWMMACECELGSYPVSQTGEVVIQSLKPLNQLRVSASCKITPTSDSICK